MQSSRPCTADAVLARPATVAGRFCGAAVHRCVRCGRPGACVPRRQCLTARWVLGRAHQTFLARAMHHSRHRRTRRPTRPPAPSRRHNRSMTALGNFRGQPFKVAGPLGEHQAVPSAISGVEDALDDVLKPVVVVGEVAVDRCHAPGRLWCRVACIGVAGGVHQQDRVREMGIDGGVIVGPDQTVRTTHRSRRRRCESSAARSWLPDRRRRVRSASSRR